MCIKIVRSKEEVSYDMSAPLEDQLRGSKQIIINYEPKDPSIDKFLDEMERLCKKGISASLNIKFNHNNSLAGARTKKQMGKLAEDLDINEVIKMITTAQAEADKKLEEMTKICFAK
jgi:hypothetical protein